MSSLYQDCFRDLTSGLLNNEGDSKITEELRLSSARWKVMGAIEKSTDLVTVSQIGRIMGQVGKPLMCC